MLRESTSCGEAHQHGSQLPVQLERGELGQSMNDWRAAGLRMQRLDQRPTAGSCDRA